jgi:hypothetical protein
MNNLAPIRTPKEVPQKLIEKEVARILKHEMTDKSKHWDHTAADNLVDIKRDSQAANILNTMKKGTGRRTKRRKTKRRYTRRR